MNCNVVFKSISQLLHKQQTVFSQSLPPPMNCVPFFILFILFVSELEGGDESHVGDLIKMKSGKIFLRRSNKEKDTEEESGRDLTNYDDSKVAFFFIR